MKITLELHDWKVIHESIDGTEFITPEEEETLSQHEIAALRKTRTDHAYEVLNRWFSSGEYLKVEIDLEADTATVIPSVKKKDA